MLYNSLFILLITLLLSHVYTQSINETHSAYIKQLAQEYHQLGIDNAAKDEYVVSLSYFRSACRLQPNEAQYWNDLGKFSTILSYTMFLYTVFYT